MFSALFAWSWTGHGQLTEMGVAFAIAQFLIHGSKSVLRRFFDIENMRTKQREELKRRPGSATSDSGQISAEKSMRTRLEQEQIVPESVARTVMVRLFSDLPQRVQTEDIHPGNIPSVGETLERDSQVRHFMRSRADVTPKQAFDASTKYIRDNCIKSWSALRRAVKHEKSWTDLFSDSTMSDFEEGKALLAKALHAMEDSYAPGHVKRSDGCTGIVESVNIWDEENKKPSGDWPGHEALDNPQAEQSRPFFDSARRATGDLISFILSNLEVEESDFLRELDKLMASRFTFSPLGPGDFPESRLRTVTG
jgi:hypothetical protein